MKMRISLSENSSAIGRNGTYEIGGLEVIHGEKSNFVYLDPISRKKRVLLNAGMVIGVKDLDRLSQKWIEYRGDHISEK